MFHLHCLTDIDRAINIANYYMPEECVFSDVDEIKQHSRVSVLHLFIYLAFI